MLMLRFRITVVALSVACLVVSIFLLFNLTMLSVGIAGWEGLRDFHQKVISTRVHAYQLEFAILQVVGGVLAALALRPERGLSRNLKWSPLFIVLFCLFTVALSWATAAIVK
jgi:hypothetical protein